jgi:hypothetical protein
MLSHLLPLVDMVRQVDQLGFQPFLSVAFGVFVEFRNFRDARDDLPKRDIPITGACGAGTTTCCS